MTSADAVYERAADNDSTHRYVKLTDKTVKARLRLSGSSAFTAKIDTIEFGVRY